MSSASLNQHRQVLSPHPPNPSVSLQPRWPLFFISASSRHFLWHRETLATSNVIARPPWLFPCHRQALAISSLSSRDFVHLPMSSWNPGASPCLCTLSPTFLLITCTLADIRSIIYTLADNRSGFPCSRRTLQAEDMLCCSVLCLWKALLLCSEPLHVLKSLCWCSVLELVAMLYCCSV